MKRLLIIILTGGIMSSILLHSQDNDEQLLDYGFVKPISYLVNGIEQIESVQSMFINLLYGQASYNHPLDDLYYIEMKPVRSKKIDNYKFFMTVEKRTDRKSVV